jgi:hypothetical protein
MLLVNSWNSAVGIATGYELDGRGSEFESRKAQAFSLLLIIQTGSGAHPPIQCVYGALSPRIKQPGREADRSSPTSAEVKKT